MSLVKKLSLVTPVYVHITAEGAQQEQSQDNFNFTVIQDGPHLLSICEFRRKSSQPVTTRAKSAPHAIESDMLPRPKSAPHTIKSDMLSSLPSHLDRNYLNFPFFTDKRTHRYINSKDTKVMFIMRGLSGSGKSSIVDVIRSLYDKVTVCSADDYFHQPDGSYQFNKNLLGDAHSVCQKKAESACKSKVSVVVIDNTNVKKWEMIFYTNLANNNGYVVVMVVPKTPWRWNAERLAVVNKHGVTSDVLLKKVSDFNDVIPLYYGWFLNESQSECLSQLSSKIFLECLSKFPEMTVDFCSKLYINRQKIDADAANEILSVYHANENSRSPLLHCTSKFCARGRVPDAAAYHSRSDVQEACGQMFVLTVPGLIITTQSLGARVTLGSHTSAYFDRPEEKEWVSPVVKGSPELYKALGDVSDEYNDVNKKSNRKTKKNVLKIIQKEQKQMKKIEKRQKAGITSARENGKVEISSQQGSYTSQITNGCVGNSDTVNSVFVPNIQNNHESSIHLQHMFPSLNLIDRSRSAHFTVKTATGVAPREVNFDLLRSCDVETSVVHTKNDFVAISHGFARYYGDGLCCVYFHKPLRVKTLFSGYY